MNNEKFCSKPDFPSLRLLSRSSTILTQLDNTAHQPNPIYSWHIIKIDQEIPFQIATCVELNDQTESNLTEQEMDEAYATLLAISESQSPELHKLSATLNGKIHHLLTSVSIFSI